MSSIPTKKEKILIQELEDFLRSFNVDPTGFDITIRAKASLILVKLKDKPDVR